MKQVIIILILLGGALNGSSQDDYACEVKRTVIPSFLDNSTDSLYTDYAEIKMFEAGSANSVELKFYFFTAGAFDLLNETTYTVSGISGTTCSVSYCSYKFNENVIIIPLGTYSALGKHKIYLKVNGKAGKKDLVKEVEL
jgi:hypothetical protein